MKFKHHPVFNTNYNSCNIRVDPMINSIWVIGDVHGCAFEFDELCSNIIAKDEMNTKIIQVGDLIDRGPYLKEVFDVLDKYDINLCVGNHEFNFVLEHYNIKRCNSRERIKTHEKFHLLDETTKEWILDRMKSAYNSFTVSFFDTFNEYIDETWFISHSPIKSFEIYNCFKNDYVSNTNAMTFCSRNEPYDESLLDTYHFFAHGHQHWNYTDIKDQLDEYSNGNRRVINLDGGCVYGGELVAYNICSGEYLTVKANKTYIQ